MCVLSVLVGLFGPLLAAQEIHIRVMNAHNGKPIKNECINVSQRVVGQAIGVIRIGVAAGERVDSLRRLSW
jgi:hypothetical protein